jgi:hypothetical protein
MGISWAPGEGVDGWRVGVAGGWGVTVLGVGMTELLAVEGGVASDVVSQVVSEPSSSMGPEMGFEVIFETHLRTQTLSCKTKLARAKMV